MRARTTSPGAASVARSRAARRTPSFRAAIERINQRGVPVFALDIPSGLNADTGLALGVAIKASLTVTFGHYKLGLLTSKAPDYTGELALVGLGVPSTLEPARAPRAN